MVTAMVNNHGAENSQDTLSKSPFAGTACNVCLLCCEEDMAEGGRDSSSPQGKPNLQSGHILVIKRILRDSWLRMAALSAGAARRKLL